MCTAIPRMERPWQLSPIPVLIAPDEFAGIAGGLTQRARLSTGCSPISTARGAR